MRTKLLTIYKKPPSLLAVALVEVNQIKANYSWFGKAMIRIGAGIIVIGTRFLEKLKSLKGKK